MSSRISKPAAPVTRAAKHAGSWYSDRVDVLTAQLEDFLRRADDGSPRKCPKAVICPHAGYRYCAKTAAWCWAQVDPRAIDRVFVLGPSHHVHITSMALPREGVRVYETPLGNIPLDVEALADLRARGMFQQLPLDVDEAEHSVELQLPFLRHVMGDHKFSLVPVVVGDMPASALDRAAEAMLPYFKHGSTLFVISSDFAHWGNRFKYTYLPDPARDLPLNDAIQMLDKEGIRLIEAKDLQGFCEYLSRTRNTICGQNPIKVLLKLMELCGTNLFETKLLDYSQSGVISSEDESSVSYASICVTK